MPFLPSLPEKANLSDVFKAFPRGFKPLMEFHDEALRGPSPLTIGERELIAAYVSGLNKCQFCYNAHTTYAIFYGLDEGVFEPLMADIATAPVDEKIKPILAFARKTTLDQHTVSKADIDAILAAGWPEEAVNDAALVVSLFNYMNRIIHTMGVAPFDEDYAARKKAILKKPKDARLAQNEKDIGKAHYVNYGKSLGLID